VLKDSEEGIVTAGEMNKTEWEDCFMQMNSE